MHGAFYINTFSFQSESAPFFKYLSILVHNSVGYTFNHLIRYVRVW